MVQIPELVARFNANVRQNVSIRVIDNAYVVHYGDHEVACPDFTALVGELATVLEVLEPEEMVKSVVFSPA